MSERKKCTDRAKRNSLVREKFATPAGRRRTEPDVLMADEPGIFDNDDGSALHFDDEDLEQTPRHKRSVKVL